MPTKTKSNQNLTNLIKTEWPLRGKKLMVLWNWSENRKRVGVRARIGLKQATLRPEKKDFSSHS